MNIDLENDLGMAEICSEPATVCCPSEREVEISERWSGKPLKQIIPFLRTSKREGTILFVANYDRWQKRKDEIRRSVANELACQRRAVKRAAPRTAIEAEGRMRLKALDRALRYRRGDKRLEQLEHRSEELTMFWVALALAALDKKAGKPTDADLALAFSQLTGRPCSRHQARSRRKIVEGLNDHPGVWLAFSKGRHVLAAAA